MTTYFGFAIGDSMFPDNADITKCPLTVEEAKLLISTAVSCLNASHTATVKVMQDQFGIQVEIPEKPPQVSLQYGDVLVVMGVRGLPRLTDRRHYTDDEISSASFKFSKYEVIDPSQSVAWFH